MQSAFSNYHWRSFAVQTCQQKCHRKCRPRQWYQLCKLLIFKGPLQNNQIIFEDISLAANNNTHLNINKVLRIKSITILSERIYINFFMIMCYTFICYTCMYCNKTYFNVLYSRPWRLPQDGLIWSYEIIFSNFS